jgi:hypothetical protein
MTAGAHLPRQMPPHGRFGATKDVTAAYVLRKPRRARGQPLVNGWPNTLYWQTLTQTTSPDCPGQVNSSEVWLTKSGAEVARNETKGSVPAGDGRQCNGGRTANTEPHVRG